MNQLDDIRKDYIRRINDVINYVEKNLDQNLSLEHLAQLAFYSPFHFHRIFAAVTGETLNAYINRKRIEKTASVLIQGTNLPLSDLAIKYGFKSSSSFSRAFKKFYGISPTEFKAQSKGYYSKICKTESKNGQEQISFEQYICSINNYKNWIEMNAQIEVKNMPEIKLAGVKHVGAFDKIGFAYEKLMRWAGPKGLLASPNMKTVTVYHDDPKVTDISKVRQTACITIDNEIKPDDEIGLLSVEKGKYAVGRFEIGVTEFEQAWNSMCVWVAEGGYKNRDGNYYELYHNDHTQHPEQKFILDICVPVE